jgi:hypothetical protein
MPQNHTRIWLIYFPDYLGFALAEFARCGMMRNMGAGCGNWNKFGGE